MKRLVVQSENHDQGTEKQHHRALMTKPGRNDPCWCGSGKKYKKCHLPLDRMKRRGIRQTEEGIIIKSEEQIVGIRTASQLTKEILDMVTERIRAGITTNQIDCWVHEYTLARGGIPAPLNYRGFPKSVCTSPNDVICHGIPDETVLKKGDIINIDVTTRLNGYFGDASRTFMIGKVSEKAQAIVRVARECLELGIGVVKPQNRFGDIGRVIQQHAEKHGFSVVRDYTGHGVGLEFHEPPQVLHYVTSKAEPFIEPNMVFTIEPMINVGTCVCRGLPDLDCFIN